MKIHQKKWFKEKEKILNSTGKLDLNCEVIEDLSFIGSRPSLKVLDLSFTSITSFEGLAVQPKIEHLILDGSTISSFKNAFSIANITKISLQNTPVSSIPNYKISLLLICGNNLRIINGKIIPESIKKKAESYPPIAAKLVDRGWIAKYPCPDEAELLALCTEFRIQYDQTSLPIDIKRESLFKSNDIDGIIAEYSINHKELIQRKQFKKHPNHYCNMSVTDSNRNYILNGFNDNETDMKQDYDFNQLPYLVIEIIKKYGFSIEEGDPVDIITSSLTNIFNIADSNDIIISNDIANLPIKDDDILNSIQNLPKIENSYQNYEITHDNAFLPQNNYIDQQNNQSEHINSALNSDAYFKK